MEMSGRGDNEQERAGGTPGETEMVGKYACGCVYGTEASEFM